MQKTRDELKRAKVVTRRRAKYLNEDVIKTLKIMKDEEILRNGNKHAEVEFKKRILVSRKRNKNLKKSAYKSKEEGKI